MATLYELTEQAVYLYELLQEGEIDEQTFNDTLEGIGIDEKAENYCKIIKQFQADAETYKKEIDRLTARKKAADNAVDRMKSALLLFMQQTKQDKIKAGTFSIYTATTDKVNVTNENEIPCVYLVEQPPKVDKESIKKASKNGETVAGAELVYNTGVRIR